MPKIDYSKCSYIEANKRGLEYNNTTRIAVEEILPLMSHIEEFCNQKNPVVLASSMPRALITAQALFSEKFIINGDDQFIEFNLKFLPIPWLKLKFGNWALISRILWFMGLLKTERSFAFERLRAKEAAETLYSYAKHSSVALVAHGMLNLFIERYLKCYGYKRVWKVKNGFFSITKLEYS